MLAQFILGFFTTAMTFILSVIIVLGIKSAFRAIVKLLTERGSNNATPPPTPSTPVVKSKRTRKPTTTIEIDPDLADRIYFKKSS